MISFAPNVQIPSPLQVQPSRGEMQLDTCQLQLYSVTDLFNNAYARMCAAIFPPATTPTFSYLPPCIVENSYFQAHIWWIPQYFWKCPLKAFFYFLTISAVRGHISWERRLSMHTHPRVIPWRIIPTIMVDWTKMRAQNFSPKMWLKRGEEAADHSTAILIHFSLSTNPFRTLHVYNFPVQFLRSTNGTPHSSQLFLLPCFFIRQIYRYRSTTQGRVGIEDALLCNQWGMHDINNANAYRSGT